MSLIKLVENGEVYEVSFPYDEHIVSMIKEVPGRQWHPNSKIWTIGKDRLGFFLKQLEGTIYADKVDVISSEHINENATLDSTNAIPNVNIDKVQTYCQAGSDLYPHQKDFLKWALYRQHTRKDMSGFILADEPGLGKAVSLDTKIYTPDGFKLMKDIHVGDTVFDERGEYCKVLKEFYHESLNMYRVTFNDGKSIICCEDHLWQFRDQDGVTKVWPTKKIISGSQYGTKNIDRKETIKTYYIPKCNPIKFEAKPVPIDPWVLGVLLGDGSIIYHVGFSTTDEHILSCMRQKLFDNHEIVQTTSDIDYNIVNSSRCSKKDSNLYIKHLRDLGLFGCNSHNKFIPDIYKYNSVEVRTKLLQGIMDTAGYATKSHENCHIYSTVSRRLADDVTFLVESLGGTVHERPNKSTYNGKVFDSWELVIRIDDPTMLYTLPRKLNRSRVRKYKPRRNFESIEYVGTMPGKCITVDSPSHLYVCEHFIVTHNTIETMNLALYNKRNSMFEHCLIVCCVNTAKYNWYDDILKHTNGKYHPYILGSRKRRDGSIRQKDLASKDKLADLQTGHMFGDVNEPLLPYFLITNIESFRVRNGKHMPFTKQVINMILEGHINMIALDEIHKNASPSSTQGKQLLNIKKKTGDKCMWIPITGTPIVSRPTDVFTPLKLIGKATCRDYYSWCQQYCIYGGFGDKEVVGYKNIGQLKYLLQGNMLRRLKSEVLDLPPIIFNDVFVENSKYQSKLYKSVLEDVQANKESILSSVNPMSALLRLRQVNGSPELVDDELKVDSQYPSMNAKLSKLFELLYEIVSRGEKVVIFSNWVAPLRTLYKFIHKQYSVSVYTGTLSDSEREAQKQKFMNDDSCEILLGTIGAAGVSHTFTVAQNVIFYDEPWTYADKQQAWERVHRIGTKGTINVYTLITRNTVDDSVHDIVYNKKHISNYIVDGQIDLKSNPALFDLLLSDTVRRLN